MIDRVVLSILFMGAILRPTEPSYLFGFSIIIVWLIWEAMIFIVFRWKRSEKDIEIFKKLET